MSELERIHEAYKNNKLEKAKELHNEINKESIMYEQRGYKWNYKQIRR